MYVHSGYEVRVVLLTSRFHLDRHHPFHPRALLGLLHLTLHKSTRTSPLPSTVMTHSHHLLLRDTDPDQAPRLAPGPEWHRPYQPRQRPGDLWATPPYTTSLKRVLKIRSQSQRSFRIHHRDQHPPQPAFDRMTRQMSLE
jgi:hypothetical protein